MADYTIKQDDTWPPLVADLRDANGPINLTAAVEVRLILRSTTLLITTGPVDVIGDGSAGQVSYTWQTGDTAITGIYQLEFEITWDNGGIETVPNDSYLELEIKADLDD